MQAEAPGRTNSYTVAGQEDYTVVDTLIEVVLQVLVYAQADMFAQLQAKSVTDTLTPC